MCLTLCACIRFHAGFLLVMGNFGVHKEYIPDLAHQPTVVAMVHYFLCMFWNVKIICFPLKIRMHRANFTEM